MHACMWLPPSLPYLVEEDVRESGCLGLGREVHQLLQQPPRCSKG
jgi:hypothetical protein